MDKHSSLVYNICADLDNSDEHIYTRPDTINKLTNLSSPLNTSFENLVENKLFSDNSEQEVDDSSAIHDSDNLDSTVEGMGIENNWGDENFEPSASVGDFAIPLPAPGGFDDISCLDTDVQPADSSLGNIFSSESSDDVHDSSAAPGVCGLRNLGNTCFMAAGLQCLAATSALVHFILSRPPGEKEAPHSLTDQFSLLVHKMWSGNYSIIQPVEFKQALGINHPQFKDYRQHDCQEFLALLLDNLHEQLNSASCKSILSDVSTAPPTPHSPGEAFDERDSGSRKLNVEGMELDSTTQTAILADGLRGTQSASSHSSESSGESRSTFRLRPIPEDVQPFRDVLCVSEESGGSSSFIYNQTSSDFSNNRIPRNLLHAEASPATVDALMEKNEVAVHLNSRSSCFRGLEDILKDAKTSNVNVLVTEQEANNEIRFDSEKFPKYENLRRRDPLECSNLTEFHNFDGKTVSVKRIKETNLLQESPSDIDSSKCFNNIKRMRLEEHEKNFRMECERKLRDMDPGEAVAGPSGAPDLSEEMEADQHWEKHLSVNQSIVVDTFQGQFKSTVVCAACKHVSVTYEPFMYLSVPLPHAMERQICVTFVPATSKEPVKYLVTLDKYDKVQKLKEELLKLIGGDELKTLALAEVLDSHIARILDDSSLLRYVNDTNRSIYAFELLPPPTALDLEDDCRKESGAENPNHKQTRREGETEKGEPLDLTPNLGGDSLCMGPLTQADFEQQSLSGPGERGDGWKSCAICLEEMDSDLRRHTACSCVLCEGCIENSCRHSGSDEFQCPVCSVMVRPDTGFVSLDKLGDYKPTVRMLSVPIVFRLDCEGDGNNNKKIMRLFGHPNLLRLPNRLRGQQLYEAVGRLVPYTSDWSLLLVDGQGYHCSRCMYTVHCRGCRVPRDQSVQLQTGDTLAVRLCESPPAICDTPLEHPSMRTRRPQEPLSLYDCLQAFSESETLDEHNPWYCPVCQQNQCATKTLSVWRYPDFLIVYLKRFVFHDCVSIKLDNKVTFPLSGLNVTAPSILNHGSPLTYNLYACVCHYGGSSAGHYAAYTKNIRTSEWHYYNDHMVSKQKPQEEDFSNAYILFYQKQGLTFDVCRPKLLLGEGSPKPNIEQLILELDSSVEQDWQQEHTLAPKS